MSEDINHKTEVQDSFYSLNILLVDDDPDYLHFCKRMLERKKFHCISVCNPVEALNLYTSSLQQGKQKFDAIVTDLNMPEMTGIELAKKVHEYDDNILVILMSATEEMDSSNHYIGDQLYFFIIKSLELTDMINLLERKVLKDIVCK